MSGTRCPLRMIDIMRTLLRISIGFGIGLLYTWVLALVAGYYIPAGHGSTVPAQLLVPDVFSRNVPPVIWVIVFALFAGRNKRFCAAIVCLLIAAYWTALILDSLLSKLHKVMRLSDGWLFMAAFSFHILLTVVLFALSLRNLNHRKPEATQLGEPLQRHV